jgi:hypothetical protein
LCSLMVMWAICSNDEAGDGGHACRTTMYRVVDVHWQHLPSCCNQLPYARPNRASNHALTTNMPTGTWLLCKGQHIAACQLL